MNGIPFVHRFTKTAALPKTLLPDFSKKKSRNPELVYGRSNQMTAIEQSEPSENLSKSNFHFC